MQSSYIHLFYNIIVRFKYFFITFIHTYNIHLFFYVFLFIFQIIFLKYNDNTAAAWSQYIFIHFFPLMISSGVFFNNFYNIHLRFKIFIRTLDIQSSFCIFSTFILPLDRVLFYFQLSGIISLRFKNDLNSNNFIWNLFEILCYLVFT